MKKRICFAICLFLMIAGLSGATAVSAAILGGEPSAEPIAAAGSVAISETTFPDSYFRTYVKNNFDSNKDDTLSAEELADVTFIVVSGTGISTLQGIEYFPELSYLECQYNDLTSLDISRNTKLLDLRCDGNRLTTLNAGANTNLQYLWCSENRLTSLDISAGGLLMLNCEKNQLTALNLRASRSLTSLRCGDNQLTSLDISANSDLEELFCQNNRLSSLDVRPHQALVYLNCDGNQLSSIDVTQNPLLSTLECCDNSLTSLNVSQNAKMTYLRCASNRLTSLDVSANLDMIGLDCSENSIKSLDLSRTRNSEDPSLNRGPELSDLYCGGNPLGSLDVSQQTYLMYLDCSDAGLTDLNVGALYDLISLKCSSNSLSGLDLSRNRDMKEFICKDNIVRAPMTKSGSGWEIDLSEVLASRDTGRVSITTKNAVLSGHTVTVSTSAMPAKVAYRYDTKGPSAAKNMTVTVLPTASKEICTHTGTYIITKEATLLETGVKERTCPICGTVQTAVVKRLAPTFTPSNQVSKKAKTFTVTTCKVSGASIWNVRYSLKQNMASAKIKKIIKTSRLNREPITVNKSGKTYYVQVRAYKDGAWSAWSAAKSVKSR